MSLYYCSRCGYSHKVKSTFIQHLQRKYTCKPIKENIEIQEIYNKYFENNKNNVIIKNIKRTEKSLKIIKYSCKECKKHFKSKKILEQHMKKYCKMLIQFNNIYKFNTKTFGKNLYNNNSGGDIYIIQTDYLNNDIYKIGRTTNIYNRLKDYRCGSTYEPRLYFYYPFSNIKNVDKILKSKLSKFNIKREIFKGELTEIRNIIKGTQKELDNKINEIEPEIKCDELLECHACNKIFYENLQLFEHHKVCDEFKKQFQNNVNNIFSCKFCNKIFKHRSSRSKHEKHFCKKKIKNKKYEDMKKLVDLLNNQIKDKDKKIKKQQKEIVKQQKQIELLMK